MVQIKEKILKQYGIDISKENILKLYKIKEKNISNEELETKIQEARKRWNTSINGANEKNAKRDQLRLEKADTYEKILRDAKLRTLLFDYYEKPNNENDTDFAKEYFKYVSTTKSIKKEDVEFFLKYYPQQRKNKKVIIEMLIHDFKVKGLSKDDTTYKEDEEAENEASEKASSLIVNLFKEDTLLKLKRVFEKYDEAKNIPALLEKMPELEQSLYDFLKLDQFHSIEDFKYFASTYQDTVYSYRVERGADYVCLVDMFNILLSILDKQDITDNFVEFKLLVEYPELTPYMYPAIDMKKESMTQLVKIAMCNYGFRNQADFILKYYTIISDNFGISNNKIHSLIKKAEKQAQRNKVMDTIDKKLGRDNMQAKLSLKANIIHFLLYWPIFMVYFLLELFKYIFRYIAILIVPTSLIVLLFENHIIPKFWKEAPSLFQFIQLLFTKSWKTYLISIGVHGTAEYVFNTILILIAFFILYIIPILLSSKLLLIFSKDFNKKFDWIGIERTFKKMFKTLKETTHKLYLKNEKEFISTNIKKICTNLGCLVLSCMALFALTIIL